MNVEGRSEGGRSVTSIRLRENVSACPPELLQSKEADFN